MIEKPKKERRFLKALGRVGEILIQEVLIKIGSNLIKKIGGKKTLPSILFLLASLSLFAQYPNTGNKQRLGYQTTGDGLVWRGSISDTASIQPINNQNAWVILDTINLKIYSFDFTSNAWNALPQDTTSLSNRINLKLNISDTASMLAPYFKDADTTSLNLTSRFATKLNISDTASMLTNYLRSGVAASTYLTQANAASTYLPLTGGTLTGGLTGTTALFSGNLGKGQYSGIHFGYVEPNTDYRKSAIVFQRTDYTGGTDASGSIHLLNVTQGQAGRSANLSDAKITISNNGNVGINDTTPSFNLDVGGTLGVTGATTFSTDTRSPIFYDLNNITYYVDPASTSNLNALTVSSTINSESIVFPSNKSSGFNGYSLFQNGGKLTITGGNSGIQFNNTANTSAIMNIFNDGNVLIGVTQVNAGYKLDVDGTFNASGASLIGGTLGVTGATTLSAPLTVNSSAVFNEGSTDSDFRVESDGNVNMVFVDASTDRVGIGTNTPDKTLHVNGEVKIATVTATPTSLLGKDGSNVVGEVTSVNQSGFIYVAKRLNNTTDAAGELIFAHGLSWTPTVVFSQVLYGTNLYINPKSVDGTNITLRVYDNDGNAVANTSINAFQWMAIK